MKSINPRNHLLLAIGLMTVGQFPAGIYLPSMLSIGHFFGVSHGQIQYILGIYLFAYGLSQLFYGPLSDHYGRRPTALFGLLLFMLGSVVCIFSRSIELIYFGSLLQGLALGSVAVVSTAVLRDLHSDKQLLFAASYLSAAAIITPLGSRVIGGYLQTSFGWQANFVFLLIYALVVWCIVQLYFQETRERQTDKQLSLWQALKHYATVIKTPSFCSYGICRILSISGGTAFAVVSPFIFQALLHMSPVRYAWISIIPGIGFPLGSMMTKRLAERYHVNTIVRTGAVFIFIGSASLLLLGLWLPISTLTIIIPMFFYLIGNGIISPSAISGAILPLGVLAGTASALIGSFGNLGRGFFSAFVGYFHNGGILPIAMTLVILSGLCLGISIVCLKKSA